MPSLVRCPDDAFVLAADRPTNLKTPLVGSVSSPLGIAQALERNRHLHREPIRDKLTGGVVERIPRGISARCATGPTEPAAAPAETATAARVEDRVALDAVGVQHGSGEAGRIQTGRQADCYAQQ